MDEGIITLKLHYQHRNGGTKTAATERRNYQPSLY